MCLFQQLLLVHLDQQMKTDVVTWQERNIHVVAEAVFSPVLWWTIDVWLKYRKAQLL